MVANKLLLMLASTFLVLVSPETSDHIETQAIP
jgi:hypothetical protein